MVTGIYTWFNLRRRISFGQAQKLGAESWALNGCPMDGGAVVIDNSGNPKPSGGEKIKSTLVSPVNLKKKLEKAEGMPMESVNGKNVYPWTDNGEVIVLRPQGTKEKLGKAMGR